MFANFVKEVLPFLQADVSIFRYDTAVCGSGDVANPAQCQILQGNYIHMLMSMNCCKNNRCVVETEDTALKSRKEMN